MKPNHSKIFDEVSLNSIDEEQMQAYLDGRLDEEKRFELEAILSESDFESDAVEGLKALPSNELKHSVKKLNKHLNKQIAQKQKRKRARFSFPSFAIIAVVVILLLTVFAYMVFHFSAK